MQKKVGPDALRLKRSALPESDTMGSGKVALVPKPCIVVRLARKPEKKKTLEEPWKEKKIGRHVAQATPKRSNVGIQ